MILSVSRRTDIPAFYSDWFFERLDEGFVLVPNPINPKKIAKIKPAPPTEIIKIKDKELYTKLYNEKVLSKLNPQQVKVWIIFFIFIFFHIHIK